MRQIAVYILFLTLLNPVAIAQNDQVAIQVLDKFSSNAIEAPSVSMKFLLITSDQMENSMDTLAGSVMIFKDKYKLDLPDNIIWFNGETSWSYLPAEQEVTINNADKKDDSFQNHPSSIFSMYKNGYKCRLIEERSDSYIVDLYPEDIKSDILRVRISIGKPQMILNNLEYKKRDGVVLTLVVKEYNLKLKPGPESFVFQPGKFKDVEIIDMR